MMKLSTLASTILAANLLGYSAHADERDTLDALLAANAEARGGKARLESLRALKLEVHLEEAAFEVTGVYVATSDGFVRVDIFSEGERVFTEALGPRGGWQWRGGEEQQTSPLSSEGEAALRRGLVSNLYALYRWPDEGYRLSMKIAPQANAAAPQATGPGPPRRPEEYAPQRPPLRGRAPPAASTPLTHPEYAPGEAPMAVVLAAGSDGFTRQLWIDPATHLVSRAYEFSSLHPDLEATRTAQYSVTLEWMSVDGMLIPRRIEKIDADSGRVMQRSTVKSALPLFEGDDPAPWAQPSYFDSLARPPALPGRG